MLKISIILLILYLFIYQVLGIIHYISEILIFIIMPCKLALHIFSNTTENMNTDINIENSEDKKKYKEVIKLKKMRANYTKLLLKQSLIVTILRIMIALLSILYIFPFTGIFTQIIYVILMSLIICVQIPTTILNYIIGIVANKFKFIKCDFKLSGPISEKLLSWIINYTNNFKKTSIINVRDIIMKYEMSRDSNEEILTEDVDKLVYIMNSCGLNINKYTDKLNKLNNNIKIYFHNNDIDVDNLIMLFKNYLDKLLVLCKNIIKHIFDIGMTEHIKEQKQYQDDKNNYSN